jgi:hypothetical protein
MVSVKIAGGVKPQKLREGKYCKLERPGGPLGPGQTEKDTCS